MDEGGRRKKHPHDRIQWGAFVASVMNVRAVLPDYRGLSAT
jgi:hypothetical protein